MNAQALSSLKHGENLPQEQKHQGPVFSMPQYLGGELIC